MHFNKIKQQMNFIKHVFNFIYWHIALIKHNYAQKGPRPHGVSATKVVRTATHSICIDKETDIRKKMKLRTARQRKDKIRQKPARHHNILQYELQIAGANTTKHHTKNHPIIAGAGEYKKTAAGKIRRPGKRSLQSGNYCCFAFSSSNTLLYFSYLACMPSSSRRRNVRAFSDSTVRRSLLLSS